MAPVENFLVFLKQVGEHYSQVNVHIGNSHGIRGAFIWNNASLSMRRR